MSTRIQSLIYLLSLLLLAGCQKQPLEELDEDTLAARRTEVLNAARRLAEFDFPAWPDTLQKRPLRLLVAQGVFESFVEVVERDIPDAVSGGLDLWCANGLGQYYQLSDSERLQLTNGTPSTKVFHRKLAPMLQEFVNRYEVPIQIDHIAQEASTGHDEGSHAAVVDPPGVALELENLKNYDLVFAPRHDLHVLKVGKGLASFQDLALRLGSDYRESSYNQFPKMMEDPDFQYSFPYYWSSYGLIYRQDKVANLPRQWDDFFEYLIDRDLWGRVAFLDRRDVVYGIASHYFGAMTPTNNMRLAESNRNIIELASSIVSRKSEAADTTDEDGAANPNEDGSVTGFDRVEVEKQLLPALSAAAVLEKSFLDTVVPRSSNLAFELPTRNELLTNSLSQLYEKILANKAVDEGAGLMNDERIKKLSDVIRKSIIYGATFREQRDVRPFTEGNVYLGIGSGSEAYIAHQNEDSIRFMMPESGSFVVMFLFLRPEGRPEGTDRLIEFFLNYLTEPEIAARMCEFDLLASINSDVKQVLSRELTFSPIYSRPARDRALFLPILHGVNGDAMNQWTNSDSEYDSLEGAINYHWEEINQFFNSMHGIIDFH